jgi:hypothetical protein
LIIEKARNRFVYQVFKTHKKYNMKKELNSVLFCIGVLVVIFSGCQKEDQLDPSSAISKNENDLKSAGENNGVGHSFDATFTKWITNYPNMGGIVGGDVGTGTFAGEVLSRVTVGDTTRLEALYHFNGSKHSFTAHVFVTSADVAGTATIKGLVTEGWHKDASLTGEYTIWGVCPIPTPGITQGSTKCFQGILHIHVPKGDRD